MDIILHASILLYIILARHKNSFNYSVQIAYKKWQFAIE